MLSIIGLSTAIVLFDVWCGNGARDLETKAIASLLFLGAVSIGIISYWLFTGTWGRTF